MDALLDPIMQSPELPRYLAELNEAWADETRRREQFREELSDDRKAEFINGEIIVHSPVKVRHASACSWIAQILSAYVVSRGLGMVGVEKLLVAMTRNDYEPDICYFGPDKAASLDPDDWRVPIPDLIVEVISPSTVARDRGVKFHDYAEHGVTEYWIVDPEAETIEQYVLRDGAYVRANEPSDTSFASIAIAGFRMPVRAAFDDQAGLSALREVLAQ